MELKEMLTREDRFRYQMLDRLRCDCVCNVAQGIYHSDRLWAGNAKDHIAYMKALWQSFPHNAKPLWLTWAEILDFEKRMVTTA